MIPISNNLNVQRIIGVEQIEKINNSGISQGVNPAITKDTPKESFIIPSDNRVDTLGKMFDDKILKQVGAVECQTCANRTYQDGSNDPGVSFKAPTHLSPEQAAGAVKSHEQEHVVNEQADAKTEGREIVSQSVQIFTNICPECGKTYVSGGVTKTTTVGSSRPYASLNKGNSQGNLLDYKL